MAIYPGATFKPTTWGGKVARNKQGRGILHVAVSERVSYPPYSGNTWHFYVAKAAPNGATDGSGGPAYCLVPEHRLLTADMRWVAGGELHLGDRLVGFDEGGDGRRRRYREAEVEWIERDEAEVYAVVLDDGRTLYTTAEHRWLAQKDEAWSWRQTKSDSGRTLVGARIPRLFDTWEDRTDYAAGWFAGFLDGEGTLTARHRVGFSQRPTEVLDRAIAHLKTEDLEFTRRDVDGGRGDCQFVDVLGSLADRMKLLGSHRPTRLLGKVNVAEWGQIKNSRHRYNIVQAVYPVGVREIVKIQTSTRTFIAEGFGMHNCEQYVDTEYRAYGNVDANDDAIVVETAGAATPATVNTEPWTPAQQLRIADIMRWESQQPGGAPLQLLPDAKPGRTGWGPHRLGIKHSAGLVPGWWFPGCEVWSSALGKECPGDAKVRQVPQIIELARNGTEDDMLDPNQAAQLARADTNAFEARKYLGILEGNLHQQISELQGAVASLVEAVSRLQAGGSVNVQAIADQLTVVPKS